MTNNNNWNQINQVVTNYKDELALLESQHKARMEQGVKHINLEEYRIRIRMIRIFLEELDNIKIEIISRDNQINKLEDKLSRYKGIINSNPIERIVHDVSYIKCSKCSKEAIKNTSYCKTHLKEQIKEAQELIKQLETNP